MTKLFKGSIVSCSPHHGYLYLRPVWAKDTDGSSKNIFCYYASAEEKNNRRCFIEALDKDKPENKIVVKNKKREDIYKPSSPQIVYFEVLFHRYKDKYQMIACNLIDEKHITKEEALEAEGNTDEPQLVDYLNPEPEATPVVETAQEETEVVAAPTSEPKDEESYEDEEESDYDKYGEDEESYEDEEESDYDKYGEDDESYDDYEEYYDKASYHKVRRGHREER